MHIQTVEIQPGTSTVAVDGESLKFIFGYEPEIKSIIWNEQEQAGQVRYTNKKDKQFGPESFILLVYPYIFLWEQEKARQEYLASLNFEDERAKALEALRLKKWERKEAGISVNGIKIDTDEKGQATISGAVTNVILDPTYKATWKTSAQDEQGKSIWIELDAMMIVGLSKAMTKYTEACFSAEAIKQDELGALKDVQGLQGWLAESLDKGWPSQIITLGA